ncbi:MAG: hypothetical protein LBE91_17040 [Tannerella sp.]|nr:hypothetical protein [Tannerella sp.]
MNTQCTLKFGNPSGLHRSVEKSKTAGHIPYGMRPKTEYNFYRAIIPTGFIH